MNNKERDMFYSNYGYTGALPMPNMMPNNIPNMVPNAMPNMMPNTMFPTVNNDIEKRISNLENQVKKLNTRISRLENPYGTNNNNIYNEPDSNMYMI